MTDQELEQRLIADGRLLDALYGPLDQTFRENLENLKREYEQHG